MILLPCRITGLNRKIQINPVLIVVQQLECLEIISKYTKCRIASLFLFCLYRMNECEISVQIQGKRQQLKNVPQVYHFPKPKHSTKPHPYHREVYDRMMCVHGPQNSTQSRRCTVL